MVCKFDPMFTTLMNSIFIALLKILNKQDKCYHKKRQLNGYHNHKKKKKGIYLFLGMAIHVHRLYLDCINTMSSSMVFVNLNMT